MTTPEPIIKRLPSQPLPLQFDSDLAVDFRNRNPEIADDYLDYPVGVVGKFSIYTDRKSPPATRIVVTAIPEGYHCVVKIDGSVLNAVENRTPWSFRLIYPDADLPGGYDKVIANGLVERNDGNP